MVIHISHSISTNICVHEYQTYSIITYKPHFQIDLN